MVRLVRHPDAAVVEIRLESPAAPTFAVATLDALQDGIDRIRADAASCSGSDYRYLHLVSAGPAVFSMGGDLQTIAELARSRDGAGAQAYGLKAAHVIHDLYAGLGLDLVTVACVAGKAFGAGFEAALACNRAVAHRGATFCLPESRFGLFPGMGATSLLARRIGPDATETLMRERRVVTAEEAERDGLVAAVTEDDPAAAELRAAAAGGARRWRRLLDEARRRRADEDFTLDEVLGTTAAWAERVATMAEADLAALERVARVQKARSGSAAP